MNKKLVQLLLLLSLTFNIAHASFIAMEDDCPTETAYEYVTEQSQTSDCGGLCDLTHLFHWTAIITSSACCFRTELYVEQSDTKELNYHPPFQKREKKPPIT